MDWSDIVLFFAGVIVAGVGSFIGFATTITALRLEVKQIREMMDQLFLNRDDKHEAAQLRIVKLETDHEKQGEQLNDHSVRLTKLEATA